MANIAGDNHTKGNREKDVDGTENEVTAIFFEVRKEPAAAGGIANDMYLVFRGSRKKLDRRF